MTDDEDGDDDDDEVAARHKNASSVAARHKSASSVAARQAEVGRGYLKREARIDELNGHPSGSNGPMITALKKYNGARCRSSRWVRSPRCRGDVSCICDIIAHELVWTHVSYYNDDAKRTKGMYTQHIQRDWGLTAHRGWARLLLDRTRDHIIHGPAHRGARQRSDERRKQEEAMLNVRRAAQALRLCAVVDDFE
jgi:hypothetical protein